MRAGSAASRIGESDLPVDRIRETKILHLSGISQAISSSAADAVFAAIDIARDGQAPRLLRPEPAAETLAAAPGARHHPRGDALFRHRASGPRRRRGADRARAIPRRSSISICASARASWCSSSARPARSSRRAKARERVAGRKVKAVDATGAGDCFDGAFLAEFVRLGDPFAAARFANVAAALSTLGYGAVAPLPRRADVEAAMAKTR